MMDIQYWGVIKVGRNQTMRMMFDTGSSFSWIADSKCGTCIQKGISNFLKCNQKNNCKKLYKLIVLKYGIGSCVGKMIKTDFILGKQMKSKNQFALLIQKVSLNFPYLQYDGTIGLSSKKLSKGYPTMMDNLKKTGQINN